MNKKSLTSKLLIVAACVFWGTSGTIQSIAPSGAHPLSISFFRMMIGGTTLLLVPLLDRSNWRKVKLNKKIVLAALCIGLFQPLFFTGVRLSGVAIGTLIAIGSAPIFAGLVAKINGERLSRVWMISMGVSIIGCVLLVSNCNAERFSITGVLCALCAGLLYASYVRVSKGLYMTDDRSLHNGLIFFLAGIILMPILFFINTEWVVGVNGIIAVLLLGVVATFIPYSLFSYGVKGVSSQLAVTLTLFEPLTATLLGVFFLKERLVGSQWLGVVILFLGLMLNGISKE